MRVAGKLIFHSIMNKRIVPVENATMLGFRFFLLGSTLGLVTRDNVEKLPHEGVLGLLALAKLATFLVPVEDVNGVIGVKGKFHD